MKTLSSTRRSKGPLGKGDFGEEETRARRESPEDLTRMEKAEEKSPEDLARMKRAEEKSPEDITRMEKAEEKRRRKRNK